MLILQETMYQADPKVLETRYREELRASTIFSEAQFEYACCLVTLETTADIRKGISLLEDLNKVRP